MRRHLLVAATAALLLVPLGASAQQTDDPCYADPTLPECLGADDSVADDDGADDVGADDAVADDGADDVGADDAVADDGGAADDGSEVRGETLSRTSALATTGTDLGIMAGIVVALLAAGGILLALTKRRRSA